MSLFDRQIVDDGVHIGNAEAKSRHNLYDDYPSTMLDALKWYALVDLAIQTGVPSFLIIAFLDGKVFWVNPSHVKPKRINLSTPGRLAVSQNRGVERPVIYVENSLLQCHSQIPAGWELKTTRLEPVGGNKNLGNRLIDDGLQKYVETSWGGALYPMHSGHPLNSWIRTTTSSGRGQLSAWVDVSTDTTISSLENNITVPGRQFLGAVRHEALFLNTPAWLVVKCSDGAVLTVRPSKVGSVLNTVEPAQNGELYQCMVRIPREEWTVLGDRPF